MSVKSWRGGRSWRAPLGLLLISAAALALSGCAETGLAFNTAKQVGGRGDSGKGSYKIGEPYQIGGKWYYPKEDYSYSQTGTASWYGQDFHGKRTANGETFDMNRLTAAHTTLPLPSIVRVTNLGNGRSVTVRVNDRGPFVGERLIDMSRASARALGFEAQGTARVRVQILAQESQVAKREAMGGEMLYAGDAPVSAPRGAVESVAMSDLPASGGSSYAASGGSRRSVVVAPGSSVRQATPTGAEGWGESGGGGGGGGRIVIPAAPPRAAPATGAFTLGPATKAPAAVRGPAGGDAYVQVGAFADLGNAKTLESRLKSIGPTVVMPVTMGDHVLYRVRLGPFADGTQAFNTLRTTQTSGYPEARLIED